MKGDSGSGASEEGPVTSDFATEGDSSELPVVGLGS